MPKISQKTQQVAKLGKEYQFGFERKITVSGKSLVVTIPYEIAEHLNIKAGQMVKLFPIAKEGFLIKKA